MNDVALESFKGLFQYGGGRNLLKIPAPLSLTETFRKRPLSPDSAQGSPLKVVEFYFKDRSSLQLILVGRFEKKQLFRPVGKKLLLVRIVRV
jgi:hypothetical protein